jgi:hypothetical protein
MAMASTYFDDSGTDRDSPIAIAACYWSTAKKWRRFDAEWREVGDREGFQTFHMSEFAARQGAFVSWPDAKRKRVLHRLCRIINKYVISGAAVGVVKDDYDELVQGDVRDYCAEFHYTFAVRHCASGPKAWLTNNPASSILYFFDQMSKGKGEIIAVMDRAMASSPTQRLSGYMFADKTVYLPLQAADILAWSYFQFTQRINGTKPLGWIAKESVDILLGSQLVLHKFYNGPAILNWLQAEMEAHQALSRETGA